MPEKIADLVAHHPLLAGLPGDAVELVAGCAQNVAVSPGHLLLAEGEPADTCTSSAADAWPSRCTLRGARRWLSRRSDRATWWAGRACSRRIVWQFDVRATSPVGAISVDAVCLRSKAEAEPDFGYALMKRLASIMLDRLQATRVRLLDLYGDGDGGGEPTEPRGWLATSRRRPGETTTAR